MKPPRKVCVATGSRAEYGVARWLMREIQADRRLVLQILATGMHLAPQFGLTVNEILADGFAVDECVESQLASDSRAGMAKSMALGMLGCVDALQRLRPDVLVVLGDRYEILAVAQPAALLGIPVAHVSGGEVTEGAVDDWMRHSISKAAWWHFAATEVYRQRIIQLGEEPQRVFNVGDPGLDSVQRVPAMSRQELADSLQAPLATPLFAVTFHPATLGELAPGAAFRELLAALEAFPDATIVMTKPNADAGGQQLAQLAEPWCAQRAGPTVCVTSLGQNRYLNLLRHADVVIGNSSSGIIEAPAIPVATVDIGSRQQGRLRASSIIHCAEQSASIQQAIQQALQPAFRAQVRQTVSLYGDCDCSARIKEILATVELPANLAKRFHDLR